MRTRPYGERLLHLVDEDTEAFNRIMDVFGMPKKTDAEKAARAKAMEEATLYATEVPLRTMQTAFETFSLVRNMAENGNPASVTDARRRRPCSKSCSARSIHNVT